MPVDLRPLETHGDPVLPTDTRVRRGVVLAAGRSTRLAGMTGGGSKALLRVGGVSLVERAVRRLLALGLDEVVVVVGYHAGPVATLVNEIAPGRVRAVLAERWEDGNGASLAAAEVDMAEEPLFLLVTADHVFGEGSLEALLAAGRPAVLVDSSPSPEVLAEGTRVRLGDGHALGFSKDLEGPTVDCGAFVLSSAVFAAQRAAASAGDLTLAGAVSELADGRRLVAVELPAGSWWRDVDTPEDVRFAARALRRSLPSRTDGPVSRWLNRPVSTRLSMWVAPLRIHPDLLSFAAAAVGVGAAVLLGRGLGIAGAICTHLMSLLDGMDGEAARLQQRGRPEGALLDGVLDRLSDGAVLAGLGVWAASSGSAGVATSIALAAAAATLSTLSMATKDRVSALGLPPAPEPRLALLLGGRDARLLFVAVSALFARPAWGLIAVVVTSGVTLFARVALVRSAARRARG
jgi:choline kinase/phosphatidylglycerophosphate synthase